MSTSQTLTPLNTLETCYPFSWVAIKKNAYDCGVSELNLPNLTTRLQEFADARDWEKFHTPKNLAMALSVEVSELAEIFQWLTPEESQSVMSDSKLEMAVKDELADIMIYLIRLASVLGVDLRTATNEKIDRNETRFPEVKR